MAKSFSETNGKAHRNTIDAYKMKDGENTIRLVGGVLQRYVYWLKGTNDKDIAIECLAFDRDLEKFNNAEKDHVPDFYPELRCSWAYSINCIDPSDGKVKVFNLKKKLFEQIQNAAEDLGDPTDPDTGWDVVFKKQRTGPLSFNVEYTLSVLRCKKRPLTAEEKEAVASAKTIDEAYTRPTPAEVLALLERIQKGQAASSEEDQEGNALPEEAKDI